MGQGKRSLIRLLVLVCGIALIILGIAHGEAGIVLDKAVHICLECIGIG